MKTIVVLGASDKQERPSNAAVKLLVEKGYRVVPVHPTLETIEGLTVSTSLAEALEEPDALLVYINPDRSALMADDIVRLAPGIVIFSPGSENPELEEMLGGNGIGSVHACPITLLKSDRFEETIAP